MFSLCYPINILFLYVQYPESRAFILVIKQSLPKYSSDIPSLPLRAMWWDISIQCWYSLGNMGQVTRKCMLHSWKSLVNCFILDRFHSESYIILYFQCALQPNYLLPYLSSSVNPCPQLWNNQLLMMCFISTAQSPIRTSFVGCQQ